MRHQHAGLAISDFPLAHGNIWPDMSAEAVAGYNARRIEVTTSNPITAFQIGLHLAHRLMAVAIVICAGTLAWRSRRREEAEGATVSRHPPLHVGGEESGALRRLAFLWLALIFVQANLGAWTIWSNKAADVATAHVVIGSLSLVTGVVGCLICFGRIARVTEALGAPLSGDSCTHGPPVTTHL